MSDFSGSSSSLSIDNHPRLSEFNRLVYPVVSRRAGGLSIGINLNPKKECSFNCVYCQVDRSIKIEKLKVNPRQVYDELDYWFKLLKENGWKYKNHQLKDISFAGDGEPTLVKQLSEIINDTIELKEKYQNKDCKIILFTNGTKADRKDLQVVLPRLFKNNGEIWYKLDFWDNESFNKINQSHISYQKILDNLINLGRLYPLILQSCFFSWDGESFQIDKYEPYAKLIKTLLSQGVKVNQIQLYTVARKTADSRAQAWSDGEMDQLENFLKQQLSIPLMKIYSTGKE